MNKTKKNPFYQSINSLLVGMEWVLKHLVFGYKIQLKKYAQNPQNLATNKTWKP